MAATKVQKWRYHFETSSIIDKPYAIKLGNSLVYIEKVSKKKAKGYYQFSFRDDVLDKYSAEEIAKRNFEYFDRIYYLKNKRWIHPKWTKLIPLNKSEFNEIREQTSFTFKLKAHGKVVPPTYDKNYFATFHNLHSKITKSSYNERIKLILEWLTKKSTTPLEDFLCKWVSFNILYSTRSPLHKDNEAIEDFIEHGLRYAEIANLVKEHESMIGGLTKLNLISDKKERYSTKLKSALKNKKTKEIWRYTILCVYIIRNNLFHKGKKLDDYPLRHVNSLLEDVVKFGILKII